jgi:L-lactate dehydrogenase (cytochrome)
VVQFTRIRPKELLSYFDLRAPTWRHEERRLASAHTVADLRRAAKRALPRTIFDFVESGAEDEVALHRNRSALDSVTLVPRVLHDVSTVGSATEILGIPSSVPFALAPTGLTRLIHHAGEPAVARAAAAAGIPYAVSTMSSVPLETIAASAAGPKIFQLYMLRDRSVCAKLLERARASGFTALILTVDSQVSGLRERDLRNGLTIPPTIRPSVLLDGLRRPRWAWEFARGEPITFANLAFAGSRESLVEYVARELDTALDWNAVSWVRQQWPGTLALKGILSAADARTAAAHGVDAIVVSNHGGRQLDAAPAPIEVLPEITAAVGDEMEVLMDSGIRRGADVVRALALGARGCLIGRPYLVGLAAAGEAGVTRTIAILTAEIRRTMVLVGAPDLASIGPDMVRSDAVPPQDVQRPK